MTYIWGQTGSGKTYLADQVQLKYPRVLVADAGHFDFSVHYVYSVDELINTLERLDAFGTFRPFRLGYNFKPHEYDLFFDIGNRLENTLLLGEEAHRFDLAELPAYQWWIFEGRHIANDGLFLSPAPVDMPTDLRRQMTQLVSFRQILPGDVKRLADMVGDLAYDVPNFSGPPDDPPHPYLIWNVGQFPVIVKPGEACYGVLDRPLTK